MSLHEQPFLTMTTHTILSTLTTKGQLTVPIAIRRRLGLRDRDRVAFVVDETGRIELRVPRYPTVASLSGAAGSLSRPLTWKQMREIANEDRFASAKPEDNDERLC